MSADIELFRRAVACPRWRWVGGMMGFDPDPSQFVIDGVAADRVCERFPDDGAEHRQETMRLVGWLPDLLDPATQGCSLTIIAERTGSMSDTLADIAHRMRRGATLPQALVEALESCP